MSNSVNFDNSLLNMIQNLHTQLPSQFTNVSFKQSPTKPSSSSSSASLEDTCETPAKKLKFDKLNESTYIGSPREVRRLRADLLDSRNTVLTLENRIHHMHGIRKEMQILFDNETQSLHTQNEKYLKSIEELESQLQSIRKREVEYKEDLSHTKNKYDKLKIQTDKQIEDLEKIAADLIDEIKEHDKKENNEFALLKKKVEELEKQCKAAEEEAQSQKDLASDLGKQLTEQRTLGRELEIKEQTLQKTKLRLKELEYLNDSYNEFKQQAKTQFHKLATYNDLEKENQKLKEETKKLKDEVHNKLVLEEEVFDLKNRLTIYKEQEKKLNVLQTSQIQNEMYLEEWRGTARSVCEITGTDGVLARMMKNTVEQLQQKEINLTAEKAELESQLTTALHDAKVARAESEKTKAHATELQTSVQRQQKLIHRIQKKLLLVSRERDSYRMQLDSYERDMTVCLNLASSGSSGANQQQTQRERIVSLEGMLDNYRDMVQKLETELQMAEPILITDASPIRAEQISRLREELDKLKNENELLRNRKDQLEVQLEEYLVGADRTEGRILHPIKNPLSNFLTDRENEMEKLQTEIERLKRKIRNMEEGKESSKLNLSVCPQETQNLREQVKSAEIQNKQLKEYFKSNYQEFRNVIYMLLGYKVDKNYNSQYKITSMYAEREDDALCFQLNSEGTMNLLENDFSAGLKDMIDLHLRHQNSIPVFLSTLTMDLFSSRTMGMKTFQMDSEMT